MIKIILSTLFGIVMIYFIIKRFITRFIINIKELYEIKNHGTVSDGVIVNYKIDKDPSGVESYLQEVEYNVKDRIIKTVISHPTKEKPVIGSKVIIHFSEKNPERVVINIEQALQRNILALAFLAII